MPGSPKTRAALGGAAALLVGAIASIHLYAIPRGHLDATPRPARERLQAASSSQSDAHKEAPPEFKRVCVKCHASDRIIEGRRYRSQWDEVLEKMVTRGATGSDQDFEIIYQYLVTEFGRVAINTAPPDEIGQVLHLDDGTAEAIVQHRTKNGKFADFDALVKVPGVPVEQLKKLRDAIVF